MKSFAILPIKTHQLLDASKSDWSQPYCLSQNTPICNPSGRVPGTREIVVHPNYVLVYRIAAECIEVVNVLHARQEYP